MHRCKSGDLGTPRRTGLTSTPLESLTNWKTLWYCFHFSNCIPCFASASPSSLPTPLLSAPLLCWCCISLPRRSGLHVTPVVEAAARDFLQSYMGVQVPTPVQEKTSASVCKQLACPRNPPSPTAPPCDPSSRRGPEVPFCGSMVRHGCLC